jgi:hypothetical protein
MKSYFLALGSDECPAAIWAILSDQEDEMSSDAEPSYFELYLYFTHYFLSDFQSVLLLLEKRSTMANDIYKITENLRNSLKRIDKFFGMKVHFALHKNYLPRNLIAKFESEALKVYTRALNYLEKWFPFESLQYRAFQVLSLKNVEKSPFLDEIIDIWTFSPWKNELPSDALFEELAALESVFSSLSGNSVEK